MSAPRGDRVTILMACYKAAFLGEAVASALAQTNVDFEVWCIDDGSADATRALLEDYARRDARVRVLEHPGRRNRGQAASYNLALPQVTTEFIAFLDDDDRWRPAKLERQLALFRERPEVDLAYVNGDKIDANGRVLWGFMPDDHREMNRPELLLLDSYVTPSAVMLRRRLAERVGPFAEDLLPSDHDYFVRAAEAGVLAYIPEKLFDCRLHPGQVQRTLQAQRDGFKILRRACRRRRYPLWVRRKRRAVCHYLLADALVAGGRWFGGALHFLAAGLLDPRRAISVGAQRARRAVRRRARAAS